MKVSIVIPVYNEEENVPRLAEELGRVLESRSEWEAVLVDDGSKDSTWAKMEEAAKAYPGIRGIRTIENHGQTSAMLSGLRDAEGDILVTMDGDLQNDPADIPQLIDAMGDYDAVCGYRAKRRDSWSRRIGSRLAYRVRTAVTHDGLIDTGCSLKAFKKECVADLPELNGVHRFMGAYFKLHGRTIHQIPVNHRPRKFGESKYTNLKRLPVTIADLKGFKWYRDRMLSRPEVEKTEV